MISTLTATLWITLIGMGLVFIAILLLWGLMEALMRISTRFAGKSIADMADEASENRASDELPILSAVSGQKKRAAVAAVAVALKLRQSSSRIAIPQVSGSAWQAVNRSSQLNHPLHVVRKSRGSMR